MEENNKIYEKKKRTSFLVMPLHNENSIYAFIIIFVSFSTIKICKKQRNK